MAVSLGIFSVFSPAFSFSPSIPLAIYTAAKPAFTNSLRSNSLAVGVYSIVGAIALGFLTDNIGVQRNSDNGDFLWQAPSSLQRPTATRLPRSTPSLLSPECLRIKQIFAAVATICAFLIGFAYVLHLGGTSPQNPSSSSNPAGNHPPLAQPDPRRDPAPWPLPPSRRPSQRQPPNRRSGSMDGRPCQRNTPHSQPFRRPRREGPPPPPPPPPPPSLAGFIQDFPVPKNFEEFIAMNIWLGAICGWILKKMIGYFRRRRNSPEKPVPSSTSLPKRVAGPIPRKTGDRLRLTNSRSRSPERRQTPLPLDLRRSKHPFSTFFVFTLAGSGSFVLCRLKARRRATKVDAGPILPNACSLESMVVRPRNPFHQDSSLAYTALQESSPAANSYLKRLPRSQSIPPSNRRQPPTTYRSPDDQVRLSTIEQVKYFYKDEIIGFENGPPPRCRKRSSSVS